MKRFSFEAVVVNFSEKIRPLLVKILPINLLRKMKKGMVDSSMSKLNSDGGYTPFSRAAHPDGINLIGYIRGEIGLGQSCRLVAGALEETGLEYTVYNYEQVSAIRSNDHSWDHRITNSTPFNINLIHIQPYELPLAYIRMSKNVWDERYNIVFWLWELERFPTQWENALDLADEIWTPSEFASESIRKVTNKPVHTVPYALNTPDCGEYERRHFGLPEDTFLFLCMYDCNSFIERKNPMGAISAYKKAFSSDNHGTGLVIKINNPQQEDLTKIQKELDGYSNIYIIAEVMEKTKVNALIAHCDVYVSLHRSEGFGLVPAEAMLLGTPVIATNWSSNTEFMNSSAACMVDYSFITIEKTQGPYEAGNRWADPNIDQAAEYMQKLYKDKTYYNQISTTAKAQIKEKLSPTQTASLIKDRISIIYTP